MSSIVVEILFIYFWTVFSSTNFSFVAQKWEIQLFQIFYTIVNRMIEGDYFYASDVGNIKKFYLV